MSCSNCNINLAGLEYVEKDNKDLCILCYNSIFGKTCTACQILIPIGAKVLKFLILCITDFIFLFSSLNTEKTIGIKIAFNVQVVKHR